MSSGPDSLGKPWVDAVASFFVMGPDGKAKPCNIWLQSYRGLRLTGRYTVRSDDGAPRGIARGVSGGDASHEKRSNSHFGYGSSLCGGCERCALCTTPDHHDTVASRAERHRVSTGGRATHTSDFTDARRAGPQRRGQAVLRRLSQRAQQGSRARSRPRRFRYRQGDDHGARSGEDGSQAAGRHDAAARLSSSRRADADDARDGARNPSRC